MPKLSDLGLTPESVGEPIDYATMPDQLGGFTEPPQPGTYRFKLPADLSAVWEKFEYKTVDGQPAGDRVSAVFDNAHPLTIIQSPGGTKDGEPFLTKITNAERKRGKRDDTSAPSVSDMDYVLRDVFGVMAKPKTNIAYIQEFSKHGGAEFTAALSWSWKCNKKKNIYADDGQGGSQEVEGQLGCGNSYYTKDIQKVLSNPEDPSSPKVFPLRITCECGANVRAFANLERFEK